MNTMALSPRGFLRLIQSRLAVVLLAAAMLAPGLASAQQEGGSVEPAIESNTGSGPWGNSAGSTIGTRENTSDGSRRQQAADPRLGPGGGTLGRAGATPDATGGPGGNPDVPFDTSMNLMFLAAGLVFAYVIYRRRFKLKPVVIEKK